ncbi:MAG: hypothetical protein VCC00_10935 [Deltaproteobacteria bacterium]
MLASLSGGIPVSYHVHLGNAAFFLAPGMPNQYFDLVAKAAVEDRGSWAWLTAWPEPCGEKGPTPRYEALHAELVRETADFVCFDADRIEKSDHDEFAHIQVGLVVLGMRAEEAIALARRFRQHEILVGNYGNPPILISCTAKKAGRAERRRQKLRVVP